MRILAVALIISIIAGYGCTGQPPPQDQGNGSGGQDGGYVTEAMCNAAHGHWNECGSPCRGSPAGQPCVAMCLQQCECGGIAGFGCPQGYECTDYLPGKDTPDAMGICKRIEAKQTK
jgi:hypothetical protein